MFHVVDSWDWSGAGNINQRKRGLALASWNAASRSYNLSHRFTRSNVIERLQQRVIEAESGKLALIGMDFPFSFPFVSKGNQFLDGSLDWFEFSQSVFNLLHPNGAAASFYGTPADYGTGGYADHFAHLNKGAGIQGPNYQEVYRETELAARREGCPASSVFRLVNPMVGVQSLAGIFVLRTLLNWCKTEQYPLTLWPLGHLDREGHWSEGPELKGLKDRGVVIVESYPRLSFRRAIIEDRNNWGNIGQVNQACQNLGVIPGTISNHTSPGTADERDALIVMLHLLSPGWFSRQLCLDLLEEETHLEGIKGREVRPTSARGSQIPLNISSKEGCIFGV